MPSTLSLARHSGTCEGKSYWQGSRIFLRQRLTVRLEKSHWKLVTGLLAPLHAQSGVPAAQVPSNFALVLRKNFSHRKYQGDFANFVQPRRQQTKNNLNCPIFAQSAPLVGTFPEP